MPPHLEEALRALRLADRDLEAFTVLSSATSIHHSVAGFHAQQAAEKALKAVLFARQIAVERTHDLVRLAYLLRQQDPNLPVTDNQLRSLNPFAVTFRYDDLEIQGISYSEMQAIIQTVRQWAGTFVDRAVAASSQE
ncbi:MAG: HEPN domain-containing protein [Anaerolineales bacterium]|nr:HEPN domain-containing protein [Anaerolineales bacterium]